MTTYIEQEFLPKNQTTTVDGILVSNNGSCGPYAVPAIPTSSMYADAFKNCFFTPGCAYSRYYKIFSTPNEVIPGKQITSYCPTEENFKGTWIADGGKTIYYNDKIATCNDVAGYNLSTRNQQLADYCLRECPKAVGRCDTFMRSFCAQNKTHSACQSSSSTPSKTTTSTSTTSPPTSSAPSKTDSATTPPTADSSSTTTIIIVVVAIILVTIILMVLIWFLTKKKSRY